LKAILRAPALRRRSRVGANSFARGVMVNRANEFAPTASESARRPTRAPVSPYAPTAFNPRLIGVDPRLKFLGGRERLPGFRVPGSGLKIAQWKGSKHLRHGAPTNSVGRDRRDARSRRRAMASSKRTPATLRLCRPTGLRSIGSSKALRVGANSFARGGGGRANEFAPTARAHADPCGYPFRPMRQLLSIGV